MKAKNSNVKVYVRKTWYLRDSNSDRKKKTNQVAASVAKRIATGAKVWSSTINDGDAMYAAKSKGYSVFHDVRHQNNLGAYAVASCAVSKRFDVDATKITTKAGIGSSDSTVKGIRSIVKDKCYKK